GVVPQRCVDEDARVLAKEQRVHDLSRFQRSDDARLQAIQEWLRLRTCDLAHAHEGKIEKSRGAPCRQVLLDRAHSMRTSINAPTAMHRPAAMRLNTIPLTSCARRTPIATPTSSNPVTHAATPTS